MVTLRIGLALLRYENDVLSEETGNPSYYKIKLVDKFTMQSSVYPSIL